MATHAFDIEGETQRGREERSAGGETESKSQRSLVRPGRLWLIADVRYEARENQVLARIKPRDFHLLLVNPHVREFGPHFVALFVESTFLVGVARFCDWDSKWNGRFCLPIEVDSCRGNNGSVVCSNCEFRSLLPVCRWPNLMCSMVSSRADWSSYQSSYICKAYKVDMANRAVKLRSQHHPPALWKLEGSLMSLQTAKIVH